MQRITVGDRVKFHGAFLRNTGQTAGGEGQRTFVVVKHEDCRLCAEGRFVAVDEPSTCEDDQGRSIGPRHILTANLYRVGTRVVQNT